MEKLIIAIIIALLYWWSCSEISILTMPFQSPIIIGAIAGLLYGNFTQGIIIGAGLQAMYMGVFTAGNVLPNDKALAACVAIPIALTANLDATAAIAVAVPFGVLGAFVDTLRKTINSYFVKKGDEYANQGNIKGIRFAAVTGPILTQFVVRFFPVLIIAYFGVSFAQPLIAMIPEWMMNGLTVAGGILPAIGFATCILMIGKKNLLPYFLIGFFLVQISSMPMITTAIFALAAAALHIQFSNDAGLNGGETNV